MSGSKKKQNREKWQFHMDSWERSDVSQKEYCLRNGIKYLTFINWRKQLKKERKNNKARVVQLKDKLNINSLIRSKESSLMIKISFGEFNIEFDSHISLDSLTGIIKVLKSI